MLAWEVTIRPGPESSYMTTGPESSLPVQKKREQGPAYLLTHRTMHV